LALPKACHQTAARVRPGSGRGEREKGIGQLGIVMSQKRILLIAIAIGFVGGFSVVALANANASAGRTDAGYSAAG
jgi:hypothetical protein